MSGVPKSAMVLAAGLGTRLRPITDHLPKPLVEIAGRTLLDHAIDRLALAGVERVVVNVHYKARHDRGASRAARDHPRIELSREETLLETGGGVASTRCRCSATASLSSTATCCGSTASHAALARLAARLRPEAAWTRCCCCSAPTARSAMTGIGDYFLDPLGIPRRRGEREIAPYIFAGIQILHRRLFDGVDRRGVLAEPALRPGRATPAGSRAIVHDGEWFHVGTPEGLAATRARLARIADRALAAAVIDARPARLHDRRRPAVSRDAWRAGLIALAGGDPLRLPRMTVLLPTRRAARALREAFLRLTGEGGDPGAPLLLPRMRPIGDLDADELALAAEASDEPAWRSRRRSRSCAAACC